MPITKWTDYRRHWKVGNVTMLFSLQERYRLFNMLLLFISSFRRQGILLCMFQENESNCEHIIPWDGHVIDLIFSLFSLQVLNYSSSLYSSWKISSPFPESWVTNNCSNGCWFVRFSDITHTYSCYMLNLL